MSANITFGTDNQPFMFHMERLMTISFVLSTYHFVICRSMHAMEGTAETLLQGLTILGRSHCGLRTGLLGKFSRLQKEPKWGHLRDLHSALKLLLWGTPTVQKFASSWESDDLPVRHDIRPAIQASDLEHAMHCLCQREIRRYSLVL
ncbi:hypothetical protein GW17_00028166 [Ensete ventricosum]|nr:hypothetical protein GW17_00028166 [Ensete ventricosum]